MAGRPADERGPDAARPPGSAVFAFVRADFVATGGRWDAMGATMSRGGASAKGRIDVEGRTAASCWPLQLLHEEW